MNDVNDKYELMHLVRPQWFREGVLCFALKGPNKGEYWFVDSTRKIIPSCDYYAALGVDPVEIEFEPEPFRVRLDATRAWLLGGPAPSTGEVFSRLREYFATYFNAQDGRVFTLLALYTMATYLYASMDEVPYLAFEGEPDAGKTQLAKLLHHVVFNPVYASDITASAIVRVVARKAGTVLIDEQDNGDKRWRSVARSGYRRGAMLITSGPGRHGIIQRPTFGPKIFFTNDPLEPALASRTIRVLMVSGLVPPSRYVESDVEQAASELTSALVCFALANVSEIVALVARGQRSEFTNRAGDLCYRAALFMVEATV